jgi:hypothetical protein
LVVRGISVTFTVRNSNLMRGYNKAKITDCSPYRVTLCEKEKRIILDIQREYQDRRGVHLSIEKAVKILIRRHHD